MHHTSVSILEIPMTRGLSSRLTDADVRGTFLDPERN